MAGFIELNSDQRRELVNTRQRYQSWLGANERERGYRGSMVWEETGGHQYLLRAAYGPDGKRRQKSLGRRSPETEAIKEKFESERRAAIAARKNLDSILDRQASINRALGLGRVPLIAARILRAVSKRGLLGHGLRVVGTNALYCYEAACGVLIDAEVAATLDMDLLLDARSSLRMVGDPDLPDADLLQVLRQADRSFRLTRQSFRAENDEGYLVDLIKPAVRPPWKKERSAVGGVSDIHAAEIEGLEWLQNAPTFEQIVVDEKGFPLVIATIDPRVFAFHKLWLSHRTDRDPVRKPRDRQQALLTAELTDRYLSHLPFEASELRMLPRPVFDAGMAAFDLT